jgi:antitoxin (DNA-binding transcriptional repressor) of toxin-antitoxin stability system
MTDSVNIHEAKTLIARAGRPVARLVPYRARTRSRTPGIWRGRVVIGPDFDAVNAELADLFEG